MSGDESSYIGRDRQIAPLTESSLKERSVKLEALKGTAHIEMQMHNTDVFIRNVQQAEVGEDAENARASAFALLGELTAIEAITLNPNDHPFIAPITSGRQTTEDFLGFIDGYIRSSFMMPTGKSALWDAYNSLISTHEHSFFWSKLNCLRYSIAYHIVDKYQQDGSISEKELKKLLRAGLFILPAGGPPNMLTSLDKSTKRDLRPLYFITETMRSMQDQEGFNIIESDHRARGLLAN